MQIENKQQQPVYFYEGQFYVSQTKQLLDPAIKHKCYHSGFYNFTIQTTQQNFFVIAGGLIEIQQQQQRFKYVKEIRVYREQAINKWECFVSQEFWGALVSTITHSEEEETAHIFVLGGLLENQPQSKILQISLLHKSSSSSQQQQIITYLDFQQSPKLVDCCQHIPVQASPVVLKTQQGFDILLFQGIKQHTHPFSLLSVDTEKKTCAINVPNIVIKPTAQNLYASKGSKDFMWNNILFTEQDKVKQYVTDLKKSIFAGSMLLIPTQLLPQLFEIKVQKNPRNGLDQIDFILNEHLFGTKLRISYMNQQYNYPDLV